MHKPVGWQQVCPGLQLELSLYRSNIICTDTVMTSTHNIYSMNAVYIHSHPYNYIIEHFMQYYHKVRESILLNYICFATFCFQQLDKASIVTLNNKTGTGDWASCCSDGRVGRLLLSGSVVRFPTHQICMSKYPWARYWTLTLNHRKQKLGISLPWADFFSQHSSPLPLSARYRFQSPLPYEKQHNHHIWSCNLHLENDKFWRRFKSCN